MSVSVLSRALAALIALMAFLALYAQFLTVQADHPDDSALTSLWKLGRYFTILTNLMVSVSLFNIALRGRVLSVVWIGGVTLWIAITGVVYHLLLAATDGPKTGLDWWANFGVHTSVPVAVMLWWLAFGPRQGLGVRAALLWMLWPLVYVVYALGRGQLDGVYPYFFTNPNQIGWAGVGQWTVILAAAFFVAGLVQIGVARLVRHG